ncbi:hypothetical protein Tco_0459024 [Tanacetum coccineum]
MGYLVHAYYSISPIRYYKDDSWWSANLKSKALDDIISIGSFVEALVLNHYSFVGADVVLAGFSITNLDIIGVIKDKEMFSKLSDDDAIRLCLLLALEAPPIKEHHGLFETYLPKLEKACKRGKTCFMVSSIGGTTDNIVTKKWLNDLVIMELNFCLFKLETIIQAKLKFTDEFSSMTSDLCDSLNSMFANLIEPADPDEDIAQLAPAKRIQLCSSSEKIKPKVSWVKIKKYRQQVYDPCTAEFLKNVKPWVEDTSRVLQSIDTVWLSDDIERFLGQSGQIKCKFPWNDDYIVDRNFWLKLVCLDPARKGWLTEELVRDTYVSCQHLMVRCEERHEQILELQNLVGSTVVAECVRLLQKFQQDDLESSRGMMRLICETQLKVQLPVVLERANIFQKNGIDPSKYTITLAHGLSLDVDDPVDVALAYREKMFSQKPSISSMDNSKRIDDSTENYSLFEVNYDGMFDELPLRYAYGKVLPLKLSNSNRMTYSEILDMLVYKLECEIRALFYSIPRNSLETASYYFKNLTFNEAHGDIQSKVTSHEKLKSHGNLALMTFDESLSWEKEQSISPLLRTPPLKKRRKGIAFQGKNLYADFLHADRVDDHFDVLDHWSYKDVYGGGCFDVSGSFK